MTISDHALFAPTAQIDTATHPLDAILRPTRESGKPVAIVSGSVVTSGISKNVVAVRNPAA